MRVTVFGGTGFLGRHVVERLLGAGAELRVAARRPPRAVSGPQAAFVAADIRDAAAVSAAVAGVEGVVNAVSAYVERGDATYPAVHEAGAALLARACASQGVGRLVHISGIGADPASRSRYIRARGRGEQAVRAAFPGSTILRPSVLFGPGDAFLAGLARIARSAPAIPLIGGGAVRLQPVHVLDVAEAVGRVLADPATAGRVYELGGAEVRSLREIVEMVLARMRARRPLVPIPFALARPMAALLERLPRAPLTLAQVDLLEKDNLPSALLPGLADLGIAPRSLAAAIAGP